MKVRCNKWKICKWKSCEHYEPHNPTNVCKAHCPDAGDVECEDNRNRIMK